MSNQLIDLSKERLEKMLAAGRVVEECHRVLAKTGENIVADLLKGTGQFFQMTHYPEGDVYDHDTHSQYYYHAHRDAEHGHFHLFLRPKGMPNEVSPVKVEDYVEPEADNDALSHLIAISMDAYGCAQSLFTTNRWVSAEYWYDCEDVIKMLDQFEIDHASPSWPANQWISAMVQLFHPQICDLVRQRDAVIKKYQAEHQGENVFEDRALEITSELSCDAFEQIAAVEKALKNIS